MKLNKIAALALAGVMAVSMLAGCAGKNTTDNGASSTPTTPAASGYSAQVAEVLKGLGNEKVTYADSTTTNSLLTKALAEAELKGTEISGTGVGVIKSSGKAEAVMNAVNKMGNEQIVGYDSAKSFDDTAISAIVAGTSETSKTVTAYGYVVEGEYSEQMALVKIAEQLNALTTNLKAQDATDDEIVDAKYTASVAMQKVSADGVSAWVALVVLTSDVTATSLT